MTARGEHRLQGVFSGVGCSVCPVFLTKQGISSREITLISKTTGFREDMVEKVLQVMNIQALLLRNTRRHISLQVNGLIHLGHVALHLVQPGEEGFADTFSVDGFVVMGEEIAKTGDSGKRVRELWLKDPIIAKDIEGLGIGLRRAQSLVLDGQLGKSNAGVSREIEVVQQSAPI